MRRHIIRWAPVALIALLAGCSGAAPAPATNNGQGDAGAAASGVAASPVIDSDCASMITDAQMQKATGLKDIALVASSGQEKQGEQFCPFHSSTYNATVIVGVFKGGGFDTTYMDMEKTATTQNAQKVTGLGDAAQWVGPTTTLVARKGQAVVSVMLQNANKTNFKDPKAASTAVAKLLLAKV